MKDKPPSIWILHDGKAGDRLQCEAVAQLLNERFESRIIAPRKAFQWLMPYGPADPQDQALDGEPPLVLIASGRRTVAYARNFKRDNPKTIVCFLKDPRTSRAAFDLVWIPAHDQPQSSNNLLVTSMAPHRFDALTLKSMAKFPHPQIDALPKPLLGVILGGTTKGVRFEAAAVERFCAGFEKLPSFAGVAITHSRRTPAVLLQAVAKALAGHPRFVDSGTEPVNPYPAILAKSDMLVVTGDSHNMVSEAAATTKPLFVFDPPGNAQKLTRFNDGLFNTGTASPFPPTPNSVPAKAAPPPENTAAMIAQRIRLMLNGITSG